MDIRVADLNISDEVSLYAIIPIVFIIVVGLVSVLLVSPIESRVSIIASTLTAVTLLFYVSERLRESAQRKLDYWNKKVLTPLYNVTEGVNPLYSAKYRADHLGRDRDLLKKHAKYGRFVNLYPKNFHRNVLKWAETTDSGITDKFTNACKLALATFASLRADVETFFVENQLIVK